MFEQLVFEEGLSVLILDFNFSSNYSTHLVEPKN